jgi:hypothetical protein
MKAVVTDWGIESRIRDYQCVFCRTHFNSMSDLMDHEGKCAFRKLRYVDWAHQLQRYRASLPSLKRRAP